MIYQMAKPAEYGKFGMYCTFIESDVVGINMSSLIFIAAIDN